MTSSIICLFVIDISTYTYVYIHVCGSRVILPSSTPILKTHKTSDDTEVVDFVTNRVSERHLLTTYLVDSQCFFPRIGERSPSKKRTVNTVLDFQWSGPGPSHPYS